MIEQKLTEEALSATVSFRVAVFLSVILNAKPLSRFSPVFVIFNFSRFSFSFA